MDIDKINKEIKFLINFINTLDKNLQSVNLQVVRSQLEELNEIINKYTQVVDLSKK